jgi:hypothetical protein
MALFMDVHEIAGGVSAAECSAGFERTPSSAASTARGSSLRPGNRTPSRTYMPIGIALRRSGEAFAMMAT